MAFTTSQHHEDEQNNADRNMMVSSETMCKSRLSSYSWMDLYNRRDGVC